MEEQQATVSDRPLEPQRRAIVIGASSGIGAAIFEELARRGYLVAGLARREEELTAVCEKINESQPGRAFAFGHDVTNFGSIPDLFSQVVTAIGGLDLIIFNAGVMPSVDLDEFNFEKDRQMVDVNLLGAMAWLSQAAQRFRQTGQGHMVGISSVAGDRGRIANPGYNSSKAALTTYLEGLRNRLTRHGIGVTTIKPGFVDTAMLVGAKRTFGVISPDEAARKIINAAESGKQVVYVPGWWRLIMIIIQHIPSFIFRRLSI
ncbi:MAG: SDR family NAD(P)-dependent oxidoreductase [Ardenticatenaceae bacterium]|nr:SDR family NAD(P)-dependent oxidoreductase [Ardenticatenaceae bacterium]